MKHKWISLLMCAVLLAGAAGCGGHEIVPAKTADGALFTIAVAQQPDSLNPCLSAGGLSEEFFLLCYDPLWRVNEYGIAEPCLVDDWSLSSDQLTWTIRLRRDVTFSDGYPLTSADVQFSYELMRRGTVFSDYYDGITAIRCPDDYTVVISTEYVKADMRYNPTPILPQHIWKNIDPNSFDNASMIGSGPFVYCPDESGEAGWLFRSRLEHFGQEPKLGAVFFAFYGTVTGAARALAAREADASFGLTDVQLTTLESVPGVELIESMLPSSECRGLVFNTRSGYFEKLALRQAMELCFDRDWFLLMSSGGTGMTGSSFVSPGAEFFSAPSSLRGFDTATARNLLSGAGYTDSNGDGMLEFRDKTEMQLILYTSSLDEWASTAATILTSELADIGIDVIWRKTDLPIEQACTAKGDWDMCFFGWHGSLDAPLTAARFYSGIGKLTGWTSAEYESILSQLRSAQDDTAAFHFAAQLQQKVYDDAPTAVLSYSVDIQAIRNDSWTGYEDVLQAADGLFGIGSAAVYMRIEPLRNEE